MNNNGTAAVTATIVLLIIVSVIAIALGVVLIFSSVGAAGFIGIGVGVVGLVIAGFLKGFRTIVEAASLYIERNRML